LCVRPDVAIALLIFIKVSLCFHEHHSVIAINCRLAKSRQQPIVPEQDVTDMFVMTHDELHRQTRLAA
jgi:hypothetical protein